MAESNVPITRISNIKMLVAFARNGNKFKKTNNKKTTTEQKTANQRNCREEKRETDRERWRERRRETIANRNKHSKSKQIIF